MTKKEFEKRKETLQDGKRRLVKEISNAIALLDVNEDLISAKRGKDPVRVERKKKLLKEIDLLIIRSEAIQSDIDDLESSVEKITKKVKKISRQIRNAVRPKIIDAKLTFKPMAGQGVVNKVVGHYTAGPIDESDEHALELCRAYHQAHLASGWSGEGYGLCFTREGSIILLRPLDFVGAHTYGFNTGSYGIMVHGTLGNNPTRAQAKAIRWWTKNGHTKKMPDSYRAAEKPDRYTWYGHKELTATECPGNFLNMYRTKGGNL